LITHVDELCIPDSRTRHQFVIPHALPHEEIHVLALASDEATAVSESSAGEMLDERARDAYRQRLADLEEDIAEAESHADIGRRTKLQHETCFGIAATAVTTLDVDSTTAAAFDLLVDGQFRPTLPSCITAVRLPCASASIRAVEGVMTTA
jgi:hypothetical protein